MPTEKIQNRSPHQLQLFEIEEVSSNLVEPSTLVNAESQVFQPRLRLVSASGVRNANGTKSSEDLTAIAAKLVVRAKFF